MKSTMDVEPECLADIVAMLDQFDIKVIGSKESDGLICLSIEGMMVPAAPKVMIEVTKVIGSIIGTMTATCRPVTEMQHR